MNGYHSKQPRFWRGLSAAIGLTGILLWPSSASAQERSAQERSAQERSAQNEMKKTLDWARIDFLTNRVQFVPLQERARRARISDILGIGDALRTYAEASAELRFNDGSMARIGERATFRFTPNTRNFQLTNGTALLLIPPGWGRTTIQTPNAVTGIQGSALFVRYIEETDTTIVGALTNNPEGPMILFTEDGSEQQALYANEIGVIQGDRITQLYQFDGELFWESSGLAEGFDYMQTIGGTDELDGVRQEIREAIASQEPLDANSVIENPETFSRPDSAETTPEKLPPAESTDSTSGEKPSAESGNSTDGNGGNGNSGAGNGLEDGAGSATGASPEGSGTSTDSGSTVELAPLIPAESDGEAEEPVIEFENSPAEEYLNQGKPATEPGIGVTNSLQPAPLTEAETDDPEATSAGSSKPATGTESSTTDRPGANDRPITAPAVDRPSAGSSQPNTGINRPVDRPVVRPNISRPAVTTPPTPATSTIEEKKPLPIAEPAVPTIPDSSTTVPLLPTGSGGTSNPTARPPGQTGGVSPLLLPAALQDEPGQPNSGQTGSPGNTGSPDNSSPSDNLNNPTDGEAVIVAPTPPATGASTPDNAPIIDQTDTVPTEAVPAPTPAAPVNTGNNTENETSTGSPTEPLVESEPILEGAAPIIPEAAPTNSEEVEPAEAPVNPDAVLNGRPAPLTEAEPTLPEVIEPTVETPTEEVLEALPPETISGGSPANEVTVPPDITPEETIAPENVAPETAIPETVIPEEVAPETTIPEEIDGQMPAQFIEEAVPFPVEQVDGLPDVPNSTNDSEAAPPVLL